MTSREFPGLGATVAESALAGHARRACRVFERAIASSFTADVAVRGARTVRALPANERGQLTGIIVLAAAVTHYLLTRLQPPHLVPVSAPATTAVALVVGLALLVSGQPISTLLRRSRVRRLFLTRLQQRRNRH